MLYDELKGCRKNPLQERLCLLVHVRRQVLDVQRLEVLAIAGIDENNAKTVEAALESYRRKVFGRIPKKQDDWIDTAKKALADEAKKVYLVSPKAGNKAMNDLHTAAKSQNADVARMAQMLLREEQKAMASLHARKKPAKPLPPGVVEEKR